jgi:hypothetical protein
MNACFPFHADSHWSQVEASHFSLSLPMPLVFCISFPHMCRCQKESVRPRLATQSRVQSVGQGSQSMVCILLALPNFGRSLYP